MKATRLRKSFRDLSVTLKITTAVAMGVLVAVVTGHGLKDPEAITTRATAPVGIAPTYAAFEAAVKL